ncbi:hypothetical protein GCM10009853_032410 [Glycomyces scopariae]
MSDKYRLTGDKGGGGKRNLPDRGEDPPDHREADGRDDGQGSSDRDDNGEPAEIEGFAGSVAIASGAASTRY